MNIPDALLAREKDLVDVFLSENEKINLSSLRNAENVREKHIRDSLEAKEFFEHLNPKTVLDFGTGGGFPLLPLALAFPNNDFVGLDSTEKKLKAIKRMAEKLGIQNVKTLWGRGEELAQDPRYREQFDLVLSRAAAPFPIVLEIAGAFVRSGGQLLLWRGPEANKEEKSFGEVLNIFFVQKKNYTLGSGEKRLLWLFEKKEALAKTFPRKYAEMKKKAFFEK